MAIRAIGKHAGDQLLISENPYSREEGTILWVKHKYLHALHQTMETIEARFPNQKAFFSVPIVKNGDQLELEPILKAIDARADHVQRMTNLYLNENLPICAIALATHINVLDLWRGFITTSNVSIAVCLGTQEERNGALEAIQRNTKGFILEPLSLFLLHALGVLPAIESAYGRLAVTKATLDVYRAAIQERAISKDGHLSLGKAGDAYTRQEISHDDVASSVAQLQEILDWADANCDVLPAIPKQDFQDMAPRAAREVLGDAFFDTMLAAAGSDRMVISDDQHFRALAKSFNVTGVWSQPLLMALRENRRITQEAYVHSLGVLIQSRYNFSSIGTNDLILAAKIDNWASGKKFLQVASGLSQSNLEFSSLRVTLVGFLGAIWTAPQSVVSRTNARLLTFTVLDQIASDRSARTDTLLFSLAALSPPIVASIIHDWQITRSKPGPWL